jgi:hypothetical protein
MEFNAEGNYTPHQQQPNYSQPSIFSGIQFQNNNNHGYDTIDYQHNDSAANMFVARFHLENFPDHVTTPGLNIHFPSAIQTYQPCDNLHQLCVYDYPTRFDSTVPPFGAGPDFSTFTGTTLVNDSYQHVGEVSKGYEHDEGHQGKKRRTNYRKPENAAKLNAAVNALIMQRQGHGDIRAVSKIFDIPYNTLRDNYLR